MERMRKYEPKHTEKSEDESAEKSEDESEKPAEPENGSTGLSRLQHLMIRF